jgi:hypothetical protein
MKHLSLLYTAAVFASALSAQNGPSAVGDFTMERVITLASASAPNQPSFPAPVLAALQAGQIELHQALSLEEGRTPIQSSEKHVSAGHRWRPGRSA